MRMPLRSDGVPIQDVVGALGFAWNQRDDFIDLVRECNPATRIGYFRGVNSFRFGNQPYVFSPYFDNDARAGLDLAAED